MLAVGGLSLSEPPSGVSSPAISRSRVDLPAPLAPTRPMTSPGATTRSSPEKRVRSPWPALRSLTTRVVLMMPRS